MLIIIYYFHIYLCAFFHQAYITILKFYQNLPFKRLSQFKAYNFTILFLKHQIKICTLIFKIKKGQSQFYSAVPSKNRAFFLCEGHFYPKIQSNCGLIKLFASSSYKLSYNLEQPSCLPKFHKKHHLQQLFS